MSQGQFTRSTQSYEKYKANLNALFDGKKRLIIPDNDGTPIVAAPKRAVEKSNRRLSGTPLFSYEIFLEAIKRSVTPDEVTRTIDALLESGHQIPQDEDILSKALIHRDESVVVTMLNKLSELLSKQSSKNPRLLKTRLENLLLICSSPDIRGLVPALQSKLSF
ncbi:MAG: hypothetical protein V4534_03615 [Myxococcota bacterium]